MKRAAVKVVGTPPESAAAAFPIATKNSTSVTEEPFMTGLMESAAAAFPSASMVAPPVIEKSVAAEPRESSAVLPSAASSRSPSFSFPHTTRSSGALFDTLSDIPHSVRKEMDELQKKVQAVSYSLLKCQTYTDYHLQLQDNKQSKASRVRVFKVDDDDDDAHDRHPTILFITSVLKEMHMNHKDTLAKINKMDAEELHGVVQATVGAHRSWMQCNAVRTKLKMAEEAFKEAREALESKVHEVN